MSDHIIKGEYSTSYKRINVAGILGGVVPGGLEAIIYSEEKRAEQVLESPNLSSNRITIKRTAEVELVIDPMQMKSIQLWLQRKIEDYERLFARIPSPEEVDNKAKRNPQQ